MRVNHSDYSDNYYVKLLQKVKENEQKLRKVTVDDFEILFELAGIKSINVRGSGSGSKGSLILCDRLNLINNTYICRTNKNHANCCNSNIDGKIKFHSMNNGKIKIGIFTCECVNRVSLNYQRNNKYRIDRFHRSFNEINKYNMFIDYFNDEYYVNFMLLVCAKVKIYGNVINDIFGEFIKKYYSILKENSEYIKVSEYIENKLRDKYEI